MSICIYNSLSRRKEEFIPLEPPKVKIYTCGVTVYDESHIGHARSLYTFDLIRKYLTYRGFDVKFVRNITDIDDKIINRANELKIDWKELVKKYIDRYYEDLAALGIQRGDFEPRATENIPDMIKYIEALIAKGFAYESGGDVYFNVRKFAEYGKLSGQSIDQMEKGVRIEPSELKKDHLDFALWKKSKENEPFWESPWGKGRPGWHIECSVMSQKFLKTETLDIHAGGRDLIFPHHENETAQAEALTGKPFAKYWIHHGLLTINSQKMAKSLGNFITIKKFIEEHSYIDSLKLFFLSTHYSHPIDYTEEKIKEADERLRGIALLMGNIDRKIPKEENRLDSKINNRLIGIRDRFISAMDDDFNTPEALAVISDLVKIANKNMDDLSLIAEARSLWKEFGERLGLDFNRRDIRIEVSAIPQEIKELFIKRDQARKCKSFKEADEIKKEIELRGFIVEDGKDGKSTLRKKT